MKPPPEKRGGGLEGLPLGELGWRFSWAAAVSVALTWPGGSEWVHPNFHKDSECGGWCAEQTECPPQERRDEAELFAVRTRRPWGVWLLSEPAQGSPRSSSTGVPATGLRTPS